MQEEIEKKTVALAISGSKITGRTLAKAISVYLNHRKGKLPDLKHGRQTIKDLMKHNTALSNIEITDKNIRSFESTAKKYGIDFALKKDNSEKPPRPRSISRTDGVSEWAHDRRRFVFAYTRAGAYGRNAEKLS